MQFFSKNLRADLRIKNARYFINILGITLKTTYTYTKSRVSQQTLDYMHVIAGLNDLV